MASVVDDHDVHFDELSARPEDGLLARRRLLGRMEWPGQSRGQADDENGKVAHHAVTRWRSHYGKASALEQRVLQP